MKVRVDSELQEFPSAAALTAAAVPVPGDAGIAAATRDALAAASAHLVSLVAEALSHPASAVPKMDVVGFCRLTLG